MNRHKALTVAGTVAATVAGGTLAVAANFGLLGFARADSSSLGALEADHPLATSAPAPDTAAVPADAPPDVVVKYEDILVPSRNASVTPSTSGRAGANVSRVSESEAGDTPDPSTTVAPSSTTTTEQPSSDDGLFEDDHLPTPGTYSGSGDDD